MPLTTTAIDRLKPKAKDQFLNDGNGLYLRVRPTGSKTFMYRSRANGKARWVTLGVYPTLGLADARKRCLTVDDEVSVNSISAGVAYKDWIAALRKARKSPLQVEQRMGLHFLPHFKDKDLDKLTRAELVDRIKLVATTAPVQANRVLSDTKLFLSYCVESGWLEGSVLDGVTNRVAGGKEKSRDRVLTDDEVATLLCILRFNWNPNTEKSSAFDTATRLALTLALLTGQRSNEVRSLTKAQITDRLWTIPKHITKTDVDMKVYLPAVSYRIVRLAFKLHGNVPFKGMEGQTLSHAVRYMKFPTPFTPHDLRRTMRTRMADAGVMPHIGEKCLNHKLSGVWAVYDRAEYAVEKRDAWRKWVRYLLKRAGEKKPPVKGA